MIYGVDVSAYQPGFDFGKAKEEGIEFAIIKATEGSTWASPNFRDQVGRAQRAGMHVSAYHYMRGDDVAGQLANVRRMVPVGMPCIVDVEDGAGSLSAIRSLVSRLRDEGYPQPLIYLPQWYWSGRMGSPSLAGLPPLWHSRYPDNVVRRKEQFALGAEYWPSFGGLNTAVAQFTSSLAIANYPNGRIDGNAFRGTVAEYRSLMEGNDVMTPQEMEALATLTAGKTVRALLDFRIDTDDDGAGDSNLWDLVRQLGWDVTDAATAEVVRDAAQDTKINSMEEFLRQLTPVDTIHLAQLTDALMAELGRRINVRDNETTESR